MALSKPQLGLQSPIQCQICDQDPKISWKCLECNLLMCSACKNKFHVKMKTAGEHTIIAIKDIGSISSSYKDIGSKSPFRKDCANVDLTVVEEYQTTLRGVLQLAISLDESLWIGNGFYKKKIRLITSYTGLQKVKCEGTNLKVISSFNIDIYGMATTPGNDLLIATCGPILKQIKSGTNIIVDTVYNLDPYKPVYFYITRHNKVILGAVNDTKDKGIVIVMDQEGNHKKVYGEDQTKNISFTYPWKITSTNYDNIFVVENIGDQDQGMVVVLGHKDIINTYSGHSVINTAGSPFTPTDFTTTPSDNVIVVDSDNFTLHILNSSGQLITYISTKDKGIVQYPCSIGLAMTEHSWMLYIGTAAKDDSKEKAILYKLNLVGC